MFRLSASLAILQRERYVRKSAAWDESKHPRDHGQFASKPGGSGTKEKEKPKGKTSAADVGGGKYKPTVRLKPSKQRAFTGQPVQTKISKQEVGRIGENAIVAYLQSQGLDDARPMNLDKNNFPIDLIQDHETIEAKAGNAGNSKGAQQWRLTIGEPGKAEKEWLATASKEEKAAWNAKKQKAIHERKKAILDELSKQHGKKVKASTMTAIVNPDTQTIDLYKFDGWHDRIGWGTPEAEKAFIGSFRYEDSK